MTDYDALFDAAAPEDSVFTEKGALDPLAAPDDIRGRDAQQTQLARILGGVTEGYLPPTLAIHGPPGAGKTVTTRRVCREFAARHEAVAVEYINLKECRSIFSAASEIHLELTGEAVGAYEGVDGAFAGIWEALEEYPAWTVLILDEIDHIAQDSNYEPSDFLYRLLRGEGKLARDIQLSAWLISNELLEVDLRLDSRVESAMSDETVFFGPYGLDELAAVVGPQLDAAFVDDALPAAVREYGLEEAARRWGDARKTLRLFRRAGETATERGLDAVTRECLETNLEETDKDAIQAKLLELPFNHFHVLFTVGIRLDQAGDQSVTVADIGAAVRAPEVAEHLHIGDRAIRDVLDDLETMGLVETWIESRGREGRVKQVTTTFDPAWVHQTAESYVAASDQVERADLMPEESA
jgi:orc1/cdc6 family replication initiation protein